MIALDVDGRKAHAATGGLDFDAALPLVVFIHGAAMDHTVWALQSRYFAYNGRAVLALDLPGHGRSEPPALTTIAEMGAWVWRAIDAAGGGRAALVGHSMGALVALEAARQAPARARALALIGTGAAIPVSDDLLAASRDDRPRAERMIIAWGFGKRAHIGGMRAPGLWMTGGGLSLLERSAESLLATDMAATNAYDEGLAAAAEVRCPTLVLCGDDDRMTPVRVAKPLVEALAEATMVVLPGSGHMLPIEQPDRTLDALAAFLAP